MGQALAFGPLCFFRREPQTNLTSAPTPLLISRERVYLSAVLPSTSPVDARVFYLVQEGECFRGFVESRRNAQESALSLVLIRIASVASLTVRTSCGRLSPNTMVATAQLLLLMLASSSGLLIESIARFSATSPFAVAQTFSPRAFDAVPPVVTAADGLVEQTKVVIDLPSELAHESTAVLSAAYAHADIAVSVLRRSDSLRLVAHGPTRALTRFVQGASRLTQAEGVSITWQPA